ncbi:MAG: tetratricopeptide repeat protein [Verrucomicrobia subdivision 3 bacterium]|nr:tetratricopeptide repeat protein [Limisphaerales bacterium]
MNGLTHAARWHLNAAEGWLGLGNFREARAELNRISARFRSHPDVLELRFLMAAVLKHWGAALKFARVLTRIAPERLTGWVATANALHGLNQTQRAWDTLVSISDRFPDNSTVPYNLACYSARLGNVGEACHWLRRALRIDGSPELKLLALKDPDLQPVWENVDTLEVLTGQG